MQDVPSVRVPAGERCNLRGPLASASQWVQIADPAWLPRPGSRYRRFGFHSGSGASSRRRADAPPCGWKTGRTGETAVTKMYVRQPARKPPHLAERPSALVDAAVPRCPIGRDTRRPHALRRLPRRQRLDRHHARCRYAHRLRQQFLRQRHPHRALRSQRRQDDRQGAHADPQRLGRLDAPQARRHVPRIDPAVGQVGAQRAAADADQLVRRSGARPLLAPAPPTASRPGRRSSTTSTSSACTSTPAAATRTARSSSAPTAAATACRCSRRAPTSSSKTTSSKATRPTSPSRSTTARSPTSSCAGTRSSTPTTPTGNAQGFYAEGASGLTLFENLFDHNGWNESVPGAGAEHSSTTTSTSTRATAGSRSSGTSAPTPRATASRPGRAASSRTTCSSPTRSACRSASSTARPSRPAASSGESAATSSSATPPSARGPRLGAGDRQHQQTATTVVKDNIFAHDTQRLFPAIMLSYGTGGDNATNSVGLNNLTIEDNTVYNWVTRPQHQQRLRLRRHGEQIDQRRRRRRQRFPDDVDRQDRPAAAHAKRRGRGLVGQRLLGRLRVKNWFEIKDQPTSFNGWKSAVEPTAERRAEREYVDPTRTVASYNVTLGDAATVAAFITKARASRRPTGSPPTPPHPVHRITSLAGFAVSRCRSTRHAPPSAVRPRRRAHAVRRDVHVHGRLRRQRRHQRQHARRQRRDRHRPKRFRHARHAAVDRRSAGGGRVATYEIARPAGGGDPNDSGATRSPSTPAA